MCYLKQHLFHKTKHSVGSEWSEVPSPIKNKKVAGLKPCNKCVQFKCNALRVFCSSQLPGPPHWLAALTACADPHRANRLGPPGEGRHAVDWGRRSRCRAAVHGTGVHRHRNPCVGVQRDDGSCGGGERRVRDQEGELSVRGRNQLEAPKDLRGHGLHRAELGGHGCAADGHGGGELHVEGLGQVRLLGRGLLRVAHRHHLAHAAGQVVEEPGPHLHAHPLGSGQEARDLVRALVESGSVFTHDRGVC